MSIDPPRAVAAGALAASGYVHLELWLHGYRVIAWIGPMFLAQGAGALAVGALLFVFGRPAVWLLAAGLAGGALVGFALSRTVGVLGFVERGFQPAPQALLSVVTELLAVAMAIVRWRGTLAKP